MSAFLSNNPSSNPSKENSFYSGEIVWKNENIQKETEDKQYYQKTFKHSVKPSSIFTSEFDFIGSSPELLGMVHSFYSQILPHTIYIYL